MFLTFLSASLVALGFIYQGGTAQSSDFLVIAVALLALDLMIGLVTLGRIWAASAEEFRLIQGMNRVRHAWLEVVPSLEPHFSTSRHDDMPGVLAIYGATRGRPRPDTRRHRRPGPTRPRSGRCSIRMARPGRTCRPPRTVSCRRRPFWWSTDWVPEADSEPNITVVGTRSGRSG